MIAEELFDFEKLEQQFGIDRTWLENGLKPFAIQVLGKCVDAYKRNNEHKLRYKKLKDRAVEYGVFQHGNTQVNSNNRSTLHRRKQQTLLRLLDCDLNGESNIDVLKDLMDQILELFPSIDNAILLEKSKTTVKQIQQMIDNHNDDPIRQQQIAFGTVHNNWSQRQQSKWRKEVFILSQSRLNMIGYNCDMLFDYFYRIYYILNTLLMVMDKQHFHMRPT